MSFLEFISSGIGLVLLSSIGATFIPQPLDFLHFYLQNYLYTKKLKRWKFELLQIIDWYLIDSLWYLLLLIIAYTLNINNVAVANIITIILTIAGIGATIGIISKFILVKKHKK